jgi:hypothetical protein
MALLDFFRLMIFTVSFPAVGGRLFITSYTANTWTSYFGELLSGVQVYVASEFAAILHP